MEKPLSRFTVQLDKATLWSHSSQISSTTVLWRDLTTCSKFFFWNLKPGSIVPMLRWVISNYKCGLFTPNKGCWHSSYSNCDQGLFTIFVDEAIFIVSFPVHHPAFWFMCNEATCITFSSHAVITNSLAMSTQSLSLMNLFLEALTATPLQCLPVWESTCVQIWCC